MQFSLAAKVVAAAIVALVLVAFGWREYHAGYVNGAGAVQQKWDKQTAAVDSATTVAVQAAASDALANYRQAGASVVQADQHKAQIDAVRADLTKRVSEYANQSSEVRTAVVAGASACADSGYLSADGLRIWNAANAAANGASTVSASDHPASTADGLR